MNATPMVVVDLMAYDNSIVDYHFATPAEVAEAHPKCGTCGFWKLNSAPNRRSFYGCMNPRSQHFVASIGSIDPALDYCRHHSTLTKENDDDRPE